MYVYEAEEPIDYCMGMTLLKDYIKLSCDNRKESKLCYLPYLHLQKFLINSFMAVKCAVTSWEGDIRGDNIYISAIPIPGNETLKILVFKQDNNGSSFIASQFPLPLSNGFKIIKLKDLVSSAMMTFFEESFTLTIELIEKATCEIPSTVNVIGFDDLKEIVNHYESHKDSKESPKKVESINKFDIKNYQKI